MVCNKLNLNKHTKNNKYEAMSVKNVFEENM